ncbi:hypothetical protein NQ317_005696 [Molorchus minor]|uniref:Neuropeptide-like 1 n=1 Tax=Molorchus minor TaxID=1323400 RepID=A0ABQ9J581_9CUCU|nr:hypothetical protein NQ317_005696 [Molorchus minor]
MADVRANDCDLETENALRILFSPEENSLQVQALRYRIKLLYDFHTQVVGGGGTAEQYLRRHLDKLCANNGSLGQKRNLQALARAGYIRTLPLEEEEDPDSSFKRSMAALAKNGQLPTQDEDQKRGLESLARNGDLRPKNTQQLTDHLYGKRNIGSLARTYNFPSYGKKSLSSLARAGDLPYIRYQYKRNIASLARDGQFTGKRNVAALLRQDEYMNNLNKQSTEENSEDRDDKRNIQSVKAQYKPKFKRSTDETSTRNKRETDYIYDEIEDYPTPVYPDQNVFDYDMIPVYPNNEKRFLGSVAKTGWFRPSSSRYYQFASPEKRHIGALARLGWLPSFRSARRFNRSGRSTLTDEICREASANGKTEDNAISKETPLSLSGKRFLLQPAVDNILLRKLYMNPRSH